MSRSSSYLPPPEEPIFTAVDADAVQDVHEILRDDPDCVQLRTEQYSQPPLHRAVIRGNREIISALLNAGADPLAKVGNVTAFHYAAERERWELFPLFCAAIAERQKPSGSKAYTKEQVFAWAQRNDLPSLLTIPREPTLAPELLNEAFAHAARGRNLEAMHWLVERGASIDHAITERGETALEYLAKKGDLGPVLWLVHRGAEIFFPERDTDATQNISPIFRGIQAALNAEKNTRTGFADRLLNDHASAAEQSAQIAAHPHFRHVRLNATGYTLPAHELRTTCLKTFPPELVGIMLNYYGVGSHPSSSRTPSPTDFSR